MAVKVKICGLRFPQDAEIVNEAEPDFAGFIFVPSRRRYIEPKQAELIRRRLLPGIRTVGVFVNASPDFIAQARQQCPTDLIQLHGQETEEKIRSVRERFGVPVIKAYSMNRDTGIEELRNSPADDILLDSGAGGTGQTFAWDRLPDLRELGHPVFLAGGISADNVGEAVRRLHPDAVDVSSSLETDGRKDREKVRQFMKAVRSAALV